MTKCFTMQIRLWEHEKLGRPWLGRSKNPTILSDNDQVKADSRLEYH